MTVDRDGLSDRLDELEATITDDALGEFQYRRQVVGHDGDVIDTELITFQIGGSQ